MTAYRDKCPKCNAGHSFFACSDAECPKGGHLSEVRVTSSTGGQKGQKLERWDLLPEYPLSLLARHTGVGAEKYEARNWEKGTDWSLNFAALMRHMWAFWGGEDVDAETGTPHTVAAMWHCMVLTEFMRTHPELDDRPKRG